ncbi:MAG: SBBP repeat-containing protein [candidate division WOR-3 bacterium]
MAITALITSLPLEGITPKPDKRAGKIYEEGIRMLFTQNVGQIPNDEVVFYTIHPSVVYVLRNGKININGITIDFGKEPRFITGDMEQITRVSYFGNNKGISGIATYKRVVLKEVYPNVDVILTADGKGVIEFQYIVKPGGNVKDIRVKVEGELKVKEDGIYVVEGEKELVKLSKIKAYQGADEVEGKYLSFKVGRYDKKETLVIDPVLTAILTSSYYDFAYSLAIDNSGNVFVAGETRNSSDFAPSRNVFGTTSMDDAFVSKLSNDLSTHIATAILTSSSDDEAYSLAIDNSGNVFVAGVTWNSSNFAPSRRIFGITGYSDAFVSRLDSPSLSITEDIAHTQKIITIGKNEILITLQKSSYVGINVYTTSGRLVKRFSFGYLPAGKHRFKLDVKRGAYILKVRIGDKVEEFKGVF